MSDLGNELPDIPLPPASDMQGQPGHDQALDMTRTARMIRMKALGASYATIAQQEGYANSSGARQAIIRALRAEQSETVGDYRNLENHRLDVAVAAVMPFIAAPRNPETEGYVEPALRFQAIDRLIRLSRRRADLNGLDAPKQIQVSGTAMQEVQAALGQLRLVVQGEAEDVTDPPEALEA